MTPAENRVSPLGHVVAAAGRGAWMGNRGRLHEGAGTRKTVRNHQTKAWITCALTFWDQSVTVYEHTIDVENESHVLGSLDLVLRHVLDLTSQKLTSWLDGRHARALRSAICVSY